MVSFLEGPIVADKNCEKIHHMAPNIYCCGAGTAADTEAVIGTTNLMLIFAHQYTYHVGYSVTNIISNFLLVLCNCAFS